MQIFNVHATHPQQRLMRGAADMVRAGALVVYPTDTTYALGCHLGDKAALDRVRALRRLDKDHQFTLVCRDLSELATYAMVDNSSFRTLKHYTPGPFTFVLRATREVPRRLVHARRKTIGIRVPDDPVAAALLEALGEPMMTTTLRLPDDELPLTDPDDFAPRIASQVDLLVAAGARGTVPTTVVDLTGAAPEITRPGAGELT